KICTSSMPRLPADAHCQQHRQAAKATRQGPIALANSVTKNFLKLAHPDFGLLTSNCCLMRASGQISASGRRDAPTCETPTSKRAEPTSIVGRPEHAASIAKVLAMDEARRIASNIAKLPGLLKQA